MIFEIRIRKRGLKLVETQFQIFDPGQDQDREVEFKDFRGRKHQGTVGVHYGLTSIRLRMEWNGQTKRWEGDLGRFNIWRRLKEEKPLRSDWTAWVRFRDDGMPEKK